MRRRWHRDYLAWHPPEANGLTPQLLMLTFISAMGLCTAGGWFGSELFPPVLAGKFRKRRRAAPV